MGAIPTHHTATTDGEWDGPSAEAAMPNDKATLRYCFTWVDSSGDADAKSSYKLPHHKTKSGPAVLDGVRNALARLSNTDIPSADVAAVKAHLQAHLDDAKKATKSASGDLRSTPKGKRAAMPAATIEELEAGARTDLDAAQKRRTKATAEIKAILALAGQESRSVLNADEDARVGDLFVARDTATSEIDSINTRIAHIAQLKAEEAETTKRMNDTAPTNAARPAYDQVARVGREQRTYSPDVDRKGATFLRDVVRKHFFNDPDANDRLTRHMAEEHVERGEYLTRGTPVSRTASPVGTGAFAGLTVPQYLTDMYAPAIAALRPFADICNKHDLPASGMTVNISRITTPSAVALQANENDAAADTGMDDTLLTENVQTAAGQQTISRQAAERGTGVEEVVLDDLFRRYASNLDSTLLNQTTTGLAAVATAVTYDDANPSGIEAWPKLLSGAANTEAALLGFAQPDVVLMHSRRWYWLQSQMSNQWPLFGQPNIANNAGGENYATTYGRGARGILPNGMAAVVDNNVATNLGSGTNQDEMYVIATNECHLWEDPAAPVFLRCEQPAAAHLGILLVLYGYFAYSLRRYSNSFSRVTGTGLITPVF